MKSLLQTPIKLNLQFFAEDGGTGSDSEGSKGSNDGESGNSSDESGNEHEDGSDSEGDGKTFTRSDIRKMMSAQMNEFKTNELPNLLKNAEQKGIDRAKMTEKERIEADTKELEDKLNKKEAALNQRDALSDTTAQLSKAGLPTDFAAMLSDLDETKRTQNVANFKKMFSGAVHNGVLEQTKGKKTPETGGSEHTDDPGLRYAERANKITQAPKNDPWKM